MGILTPLDLTLFGGSLLAVMLLGLWAGRKEDTSEDYYLAGKSARWWGVTGSIFGSNISANHMVGMMGVGFSLGFVESQFEISAIAGLLLMCYGFLPVYRKLNVYTLSEYMSQRYNEASRVLYSLVMIIAIVVIQMVPAFYIGSRSINVLLLEETQIQQAVYPAKAVEQASATDAVVAEVADAAPISTAEAPTVQTSSARPGKVNIDFGRYVTMIFIMAIVTGVYTIVGGLKAVIFTDVIQSVMMLVAAMLVAYLTFSQEEIGGWAGMMEMDAATDDSKMHLYLPSDHPQRPWSGMLTGLLILHFNYWGTNQFIVQRALAAKSGREARIGIITAGFLKLLIPFICIGAGVAAFYLFQARMPNATLDGDTAFPMLLREVVSPLGAGLTGLVAAGLVGAILSSIDSMLNSGATLITFDVYKRYINPNATDKQLIGLGRWCIGVFVVGSALLATVIMDPNTDEHFFTYVAGHQSRLVAGLVVAFGLGMFWKRATPAGGLAAIVSGIVFSYGLTWLYNDYWHTNETLANVLGDKLNFLHAAAASAFLSACMLVIVSLLTQPDAEKSKLNWSELGGHRPGAIRLRVIKLVVSLGVYAVLAWVMVSTSLTPTAAAFVGGIWTWGLFVHHAITQKPIGEDAGLTLVKDDRVWAGLLAAVAIFMMFYYA